MPSREYLLVLMLLGILMLGISVVTSLLELVISKKMKLFEMMKMDMIHSKISQLMLETFSRVADFLLAKQLLDVVLGKERDCSGPTGRV